MSHSLARIWIHGILGTKGRKPLINENIRKDLCLHIQQEMEKTGCGVRSINGINNHIHVLFLLPKALSIAQVMKAIKGESSHWVSVDPLWARSKNISGINRNIIEPPPIQGNMKGYKPMISSMGQPMKIDSWIICNSIQGIVEL